MDVGEGELGVADDVGNESSPSATSGSTSSSDKNSEMGSFPSDPSTYTSISYLYLLRKCLVYTEGKITYHTEIS